jgi:hypothetical protein
VPNVLARPVARSPGLAAVCAKLEPASKAQTPAVGALRYSPDPAAIDPSVLRHDPRLGGATTRYEARRTTQERPLQGAGSVRDVLVVDAARDATGNANAEEAAILPVVQRARRVSGREEVTHLLV